MYIVLVLLALTTDAVPLQDMANPEIITIEAADPLIAERQEEARKKMERKNRGLVQNVRHDFNKMKQDMSALFGREFEAGRLTQQAISARKHAKAAKALQKEGKVYDAACAWLDALDIKGKKAYFKAMRSIAKDAYQSKLKLAEESARSGDLNGSLDHFAHLSLFLRSLDDHKLKTFPTVDVDEAVYKAREANAENAYAKGLEAFERADWDSATASFRATLGYLDPFRDSREKLGLSLLALGRLHLGEKDYPSASDILLQALETLPNHEEIRLLAGETCYQLGDYYYQNKRYRAALAYWEKLMALDHPYRDILLRSEDARMKATRHVAISPMSSAGNGSGEQDGVLLFDQALRQFLAENASEFFLLDAAYAMPTVEIANNSMVVTQEGETKSQRLKLKEHVFGKANENVTEVTITKLDYTDFSLTRILSITGQIMVTDHHSKGPQIYGFDQSWTREHHWTEIHDTKVTKDFSPTDSAAIFGIGQVVQDLAGRKKPTVAQVQKLTKASRGVNDLKDMASEFGRAFGRELLKRLDFEAPLAPPADLDLSAVR